MSASRLVYNINWLWCEWCLQSYRADFEYLLPLCCHLKLVGLLSPLFFTRKFPTVFIFTPTMRAKINPGRNWNSVTMAPDDETGSSGQHWTSGTGRFTGMTGVWSGSVFELTWSAAWLVVWCYKKWLNLDKIGFVMFSCLGFWCLYFGYCRFILTSVQ